VKQRIKVIDNAIETQRMQMQMLSTRDITRHIHGHQLNIHEHGNESNPLHLKWFQIIVPLPSLNCPIPWVTLKKDQSWKVNTSCELYKPLNQMGKKIKLCSFSHGIMLLLSLLKQCVIKFNDYALMTTFFIAIVDLIHINDKE
jgi:hypothetical protein